MVTTLISSEGKVTQFKGGKSTVVEQPGKTGPLRSWDDLVFLAVFRRGHRAAIEVGFFRRGGQLLACGHVVGANRAGRARVEQPAAQVVDFFAQPDLFTNPGVGAAPPTLQPVAEQEGEQEQQDERGE